MLIYSRHHRADLTIRRLSKSNRKYTSYAKTVIILQIAVLAEAVGLYESKMPHMRVHMSTVYYWTVRGEKIVPSDDRQSRYW